MNEEIKKKENINPAFDMSYYLDYLLLSWTLEINRSTDSMSFIRALSPDNKRNCSLPRGNSNLNWWRVWKRGKNKLNWILTTSQGLAVWNYQFTWHVSSAALPPHYNLGLILFTVNSARKKFPVLIHFCWQGRPMCNEVTN